MEPKRSTLYSQKQTNGPYSSQMNPVHTLAFCFLDIRLYIIH